MENSRRLPSYIVPIKQINLDRLKIVPAEPVTVNDDWQREHWSGSIEVEEDGINGLTDNWVYLHALLADSRLPLYVFNAEGQGPSDFQVKNFDNQGNTNILPRVIEFDPTDLLPAVYLDYTEPPEISYKEAYEGYLKQDDTYSSAVKNYFVAQDINHHKRLRVIDNSYWQIVMFVSVLEALLPPPVFCSGKCEVCGKGLKHVLNDPGKDWDDLIFNKINDKGIKKQYRDVLDEARWKIRNDTVHNGLAPSKDFWRAAALPNGITEYTTSKSIESYKKDKYSLESLIEQLRQICRYVLLNKAASHDVFPALKGIEVHSATLTISEPTTVINLN